MSNPLEARYFYRDRDGLVVKIIESSNGIPFKQIIYKYRRR
jgi:hypothetical protein